MSANLFRHKIRGAIQFHTLVCRGRRLEVLTKHNLLVRLNPYEYIDGFVLRYGYYEEEVLCAILENLKPGDVFWDVGANLGLHSLTVALTRKDVRVHAFEPNPSMAELIRSGTSLNHLQVEVEQIALDSADGVAKFFVHEGNAGRSSLINWDSDSSLKQIDVTTARGEGLVGRSEIPAPNVMKIDVEGSEGRVLTGLGGLLFNSNLRAIVLEDSVHESSEPKRLLRDAGFSLTPLNRREATGHNLENYLARRPGSS